MKKLDLIQEQKTQQMTSSDDEIIEKFSKQCVYCERNTLLQYEYQFACITCGYNVIKRKNQLCKIQRKN